MDIKNLSGSQGLDGTTQVNFESLQKLVKTLVSESGLPDAPSSPQTGVKDLPTLAAPTAGGLSLDMLAKMINNEARTQATRDGVNSLEARGKEREEVNQKKLEEIMERLDDMKSKGVLDVFKKVFAWVGAILGAVAGALSLAVGVATGNPLLIAGGAILATMAVNNIVSMATDGKVSIGAGIGAIAKSCGASEEVAGYIGMAFEMAITIVGIGLSLGAGAGSAVANAKNTLSQGIKLATNVTNVVNSAVQVGSGATTIASSVNTYKLAQGQADMKELQAILERIQQAQDMDLDFMKGVMERAEKMLADVNEVVQNCNEAQTAILSNTAPSMA